MDRAPGRSVFANSLASWPLGRVVKSFRAPKIMEGPHAEASAGLPMAAAIRRFICGDCNGGLLWHKRPIDPSETSASRMCSQAVPGWAVVAIIVALTFIPNTGKAAEFPFRSGVKELGPRVGYGVAKDESALRSWTGLSYGNKSSTRRTPQNFYMHTSGSSTAGNLFFSMLLPPARNAGERDLVFSRLCLGRCRPRSNRSARRYHE